MMNETKQSSFIISRELVEAIGNYIISQPCQNQPVGTAYQLITALQQLQPAPNTEAQELKQ